MIDASPADFRKPCTACSGAPTRGPLLSSLTPGDFAGTPSTTSVSRRGVAIRARLAGLETPRLQALDNEALQILRRARLHARRDLLGEQLEQQFRHSDQISVKSDLPRRIQESRGEGDLRRGAGAGDVELSAGGVQEPGTAFRCGRRRWGRCGRS